jgi:hypothetical protein
MEFYIQTCTDYFVALFIEYFVYYSDEIKGDKMGEVYSTHWKDNKYEILNGKLKVNTAALKRA